ncbi:MAG: hypothetical protein FWC68_03470 [Oscillospiraceae bacterium]|nr:hypothetical protein [Oscillospiraceae bacterium]
MMQPYVAARAQLPTFILFVLTIFFIERFLETNKKRYAVGLFIIPVIISNIHAAVFPFYFILYLPYVAEYLLCVLCKKKETEEETEKEPYKVIMRRNNKGKWLIVIMLVCLGAGLLTPVFPVPYTYVYNKLMGETMQSINEHLPLVIMNNINFIVASMFFLIILMFTDTKIRLCDLFMLGGLIALTFNSRRQESMFILAGVFILIRLINAMFEKYDPEGCSKMERAVSKRKIQVVVILVVTLLAIDLYRPKMGNPFINEHSYPTGAATFMLENLDVDNIRLYNEYNYGAYLVYRGIPVFIDSRASLYAPEFNPDVYVFRDFINISGLNVTNIEERFDYYGITHLIMFENARLRMFINQSPERYNNIYDDGRFVVYERTQSSNLH